MFRLICLIIGYLIGLIQTAYLVGRFFKTDIRDHGSGNLGTTNTLRVLGFKAGLLVFVSDVLKAVLAYTICSLLFNGTGTFIIRDYINVLPGLYGGIGVILGHCFPFYLKFKGGKGIASTLGIILCLDLKIALTVFAFGIILTIIFKYISLAALVITLSFPFGLIIRGYSLETIILGFIITIVSWYLHRENIKRLISGEENKFTIKKQV